MGWGSSTPRGGPSPPTPDVSSSSDVGAALSTSGRRPGSPYCPCIYSLHPGLEGPRASLWGSGICSLRGFISLKSRPAPHSCRPCVPRGLWAVRATLVQRAQPTLQYQAPPGGASTQTRWARKGWACARRHWGCWGPWGHGLASQGAQSPFCPGPRSPAMGSWEQGLSPADVLPATFFIPGSLQFIKGGSKHTRRVCLQMAGVHAGPQWT